MLDIGCGSGKDSAVLISNGFNVTGVDASKGIIAEARGRVPNGIFIVGDLRSLKLRKRFDGIWCCASLFHVNKAEAKKAVCSFKKLLKNDGVLFISLKKGSGEMVRTYKGGNERFFAYYERDEAVGLVSEDFKVLEVYVSAKDKHGERWIEIFARPK